MAGSIKVTLNDVRLAFPAIYEMESFQGEGKPYAKATFLYKEGSEAHKRLVAASKQAAESKWPDAKSREKFLAKIKKDDKGCIHDGNDCEYDGFEDHLFTPASNPDTLPTVVDKDRTRLEAKDGKPYAGCYVNAIVEVWVQDNAWGKRINAKLKGIQFIKDGDAFVGGPPSDPDDFEDLSDHGDDDEDMSEFTG